MGWAKYDEDIRISYEEHKYKNWDRELQESNFLSNHYGYGDNYYGYYINRDAFAPCSAYAY